MDVFDVWPAPSKIINYVVHVLNPAYHANRCKVVTNAKMVPSTIKIPTNVYHLLLTTQIPSLMVVIFHLLGGMVHLVVSLLLGLLIVGHLGVGLVPSRLQL